MRKARSGYATLVDPLCPTKEADTFTCAHCQNIRHVKPFCDPADLGGLCKICMGVICEQCLGKGCEPWEEKLKRVERSNDFNRWIDECK